MVQEVQEAQGPVIRPLEPLRRDLEEDSAIGHLDKDSEIPSEVAQGLGWRAKLHVDRAEDY